MNSVERRELRKVVELDFNTVETRIHQDAGRELKRRTDAIEDAQDDRRLEAQEILDDARVTFDRFQADMKDYRDQLDRLGFVWAWSYNRNPSNFSVPDTVEDLSDKVASDLKQKVRSHVDSVVKDAVHTLHTKRNEILRSIAMDALDSPEAIAMLGDVPEVNELLEFEPLQLEGGE